MPHIKFSHIYGKLIDRNSTPIKSAKLLDVLTVNLESLSRDFIDYDTDYGKYSLPTSGKFMMLIFLRMPEVLIANDIFTTLRPWTSDKEKFYRSKIGLEFECILPITRTE